MLSYLLASAALAIDDQGLASFVQWLRRGGVTGMDHWELKRHEKMGVGMFATKPMQGGDVLISVPQSLALGVPDALAHPSVGPMLRRTLPRAPEGYEEDCVATCALLLHEVLVAGPASHWAPFLDILPFGADDGGLSVCAGYATRPAALRGMPAGLRLLCDAHEATLEARFARLDATLIAPLLALQPPPQPPPPRQQAARRFLPHATADERLRAWKWAWRIAMSRALGPVYNSTEHGCFLVPAMEIINHGSVPEASHSLFGAAPFEGRAGVVLHNARAAGEQLLVRYFDARKSQHLVFVQYGFVPPPAAAEEESAAAGGGTARDALPVNMADAEQGDLDVHYLRGAPTRGMARAMRRVLGLLPMAAAGAEADADDEQPADLLAEPPRVLCALAWDIARAKRYNGALDPAAVGATPQWQVLLEAEVRVATRALALLGAAIEHRVIDCLQLVKTSGATAAAAVIV
jgi:hypothetical protein